MVRRFYNLRHAGGGAPWWTWAIAAVYVVLAIGISLDTPKHIARFAPAIRVQAVLTYAMPPNNVIGVELAERPGATRRQIVLL